ncbi:MAG: histidinol dehydrogenase [Eubacteriales bacterium]|nr:histidinol dehydrogenase [Eubacteriales bacterium]
MIQTIRYTGQKADDILNRAEEQKKDVTAVVTDILANVKSRGDAAVLDYCEKFDGSRPRSLLVTQEEVEAASQSVEPALLRTMELAAANIRRFHSQQKRSGFVDTMPGGAVLGQRVLPLQSVGLYVPGGTARYPSSVLMDAIPAQIAGVENIVMTTPPDQNGNVPPVILAAAKLAGVKTIVKLGGAQAVAALAYGTESVPKVDKIVGPGNIYVATAKQLCFGLGLCAIDMIAGPSEIMVIADGKSNPVHIAADLLSQAEHDKLSSAWLATDDEAFALKVRDELERQIPLLPRQEIARASIDDNGRIIVVDDLRKAAQVANEMAPEHLELSVDDPFGLLPFIRNAGSIFMGRNCPESLGDYLAGPNHTLPTGGTARYSSPLGVDDFCKRSSYLYYTKEALHAVADDVMRFAEKEGLHAHANAVQVRMKEDDHE